MEARLLMGRKKGGDGGAGAIQQGQDRAIQALEQGKREGYGFLDTAQQQGLEGINQVVPFSRQIMGQSMGNLANFDELAGQQADYYDESYLAPSQRQINETLKNLFRSGGVGGSSNSRLQNFMARNADEMAMNEAQRRLALRNQARQDLLNENTNLYNIGSQPEMFRAGTILDLGKTRANTSVGQASQMGNIYTQSAGQIANAQQQAQQRRDNKGGQALGLGAGLIGNVAGAFVGSDAKLKENIKPVAKLDNGLIVYAYNFKGKPNTELGLIAQEVMQIKPHAVKRHQDGYLMVNYEEAIK